MIVRADYYGGPGASRPDAFLLLGPARFGPHYYPTRLSVSKERELNRQGNFCGGEDVEDIGSKNREIHVSGLLLESERESFELLLDNDEPLEMLTAAWSGEVQLEGGEYEGPIARDAETGDHLFKYSLDLVSTGRDEDYRRFENGIISDGS